MDTTILVIAVSLFMIVLLFLGVPIAISLGICGVVGIVLLGGWNVGMAVLSSLAFEVPCNWLYTVVPLFILMGSFAFRSGIVEEAFDGAHQLLGKIPGSLAAATIGASAAFAACSGSSVASAATMGRVALPSMKENKYDMKLATGSIAAGGLLAVVIPPSVVIVLYGIFSGVSIGKMLIAGIIPGIITAILYICAIVIWWKIDPAVAPMAKFKTSFAKQIKAVLRMWKVLVLFLAVIGGIYSGVFTVTEAAAAGAMFAFIILILKAKRKTWEYLKVSLMESAQTTVSVFILVIGATIFARFMSMSMVPQQLTSALLGLNVDPAVIIWLIIALYVPLGMFLDPSSILVLTIPLIAPVVSGLGFDLIWFGVIGVMMIELSMLTPPVGLNLFVLNAAAPEVRFEDIVRGCVPFMIVQLVVVVIVFFFPEIALILPRLMSAT